MAKEVKLQPRRDGEQFVSYRDSCSQEILQIRHVQDMLCERVNEGLIQPEQAQELNALMREEGITPVDIMGLILMRHSVERPLVS